ncbi:MAG TPA: hypothetical protein VK181_17940, partial [Rhizobium sp.]|nr:hypothetical protein [Rhizobium sp.]
SISGHHAARQCWTRHETGSTNDINRRTVLEETLSRYHHYSAKRIVRFPLREVQQVRDHALHGKLDAAAGPREVIAVDIVIAAAVEITVVANCSPALVIVACHLTADHPGDVEDEATELLSG